MANRLKSKKGKPTDRASFRPEKEASFRASEAIKDDRVHKIAGAFSLLFASFLFIAFTSYLFTWKEDQPIVLNGISTNKASNLLGNLGAYISYQFVNHGFGVASYFICSFFFILGANWLFRRKIFSIGRNLRYVIVGILFFSTALAFITEGSDFSWGGAVGEMITDWLIRFLGWVGTAALL